MTWLLVTLFALAKISTMIIVRRYIVQLRKENSQMRQIIHHDIDRLTNAEYNDLIDVIRQRTD